MAANGANACPPTPAEHRSLVSLINSNTLLNRQLSQICAINGRRTNGVKADLQRRITELISHAYTSNDNKRFREIERSISDVRGSAFQTNNSSVSSAPYHAAYNTPTYPTNAGSPMPGMTPRNGYNYGQVNGNGVKPQPGARQGMPGAPYSGGARMSVSAAGQSFYFKESPFYEILTRLGPVRTCEVMAQHRSSVSFTFKGTDHELLQRSLTDTSLRVMVFCAAGNQHQQLIAFPHQSELKVNSQDVKANLRGMKNKPGTTRPVDITDKIRLRQPSYPNVVELIYALTQKNFYALVNIVKSKPIEELVTQISRRRISKASVVLEITKKASDTDIVMSSLMISLKCPLSYMRLVTPCRSTNCTHIQCFDATSYLQLQQQGPQWQCPICSKPAPFEQLAVDEYAKDVLANTRQSVEQVEIGTDGKWKVPDDEEEDDDDEPESNKRRESYALDSDDDDTYAAIANRSYAGHTAQLPAPRSSLPQVATPVSAKTASREPSTIPRHSAGTKRTHDAVIDLTLSSDDDEPPRPPPKRQHIG